jgi:hypothetical protein
VSPDKRSKRRQKKRATGNGKQPEQASTSWAVAFYKTAAGAVPAKDFLEDCPQPVQEMLLAIIVAVRDAPPPAFPTSAMWQAMHAEMRGFHEARDAHDGRLYRLFCVVDRQAPEHGLDAPTVALISGGIKAARTAMPPSVYNEALDHRRDYLATRRILLPAGIPAGMPKA